MLSSHQLNAPYLIFLGSAPDAVYAKTGIGISQWAPQSCIAQLRFAGCPVDIGVADMTIAQAVSAGAKSLVIGAAPVGGAIEKEWLPVLEEAIAAGLDIVSGLHSKLTDFPSLCEAAEKYGVRLIDVRVPPAELPIGDGMPRKGRRLLTVGTDCSVGKKYTALAITQALTQQQVDCDFRATGQTGIMIAGEGIALDSVIADFIAGAAESLSPANHCDHWDIIEGQGSLFQPAYAGVSLGLLHGSQPDAIVLCHDPCREATIGCPEHQLPRIQDCIDTHLRMGRLTNPGICCVGISVNTSALSEEEGKVLLSRLQQQTSLPCVDPVRHGVSAIVENLWRQFPPSTDQS